jgi:hypothetical protein
VCNGKVFLASLFPLEIGLAATNWPTRFNRLSEADQVRGVVTTWVRLDVGTHSASSLGRWGRIRAVQIHGTLIDGSRQANRPAGE